MDGKARPQAGLTIFLSDNEFPLLLAGGLTSGQAAIFSSEIVYT